jgi:hypothetical protein
VISGKVFPLTYFKRLGRGGGPHIGTDRKTSVSLTSLSPRRQADIDVSWGVILPEWLCSAQIPFCKRSTVQFPFFAEWCRCETAGSTLRNVPFEGPWQDHEKYQSVVYEEGTRYYCWESEQRLTTEEWKTTFGVRNDKQANVLLRATLFGLCPVHVERRTSLKFSRRSHSHRFTRRYVERRDPIRPCWSVCLAGVQIH